MLNICFCLKTLLPPGRYLVKLGSTFPFSHKSPTLSIFPNISFRLDTLSTARTAEISFSAFLLKCHSVDLMDHPTEVYLLFLFAFFLLFFFLIFEKNKIFVQQNFSDTNNIYIINLL